MSALYQRTKFVVATFVVALLLFTLNRAVFLIYNHDLASGYGIGELMLCFVHGLKLDISVAGYISAIPLLLSIATLWIDLGDRGWMWLRRAVMLYFAIVVTIIGAIETADIGMFGEWQRRIDSQIFIYTPREMMASLSASDYIYAVLYIGTTLVVGLSLYRVVASLYLKDTKHRKVGQRVLATAYMTLMAGLLFIAIRGGVSTATANISKAYFSSKMFLNQTAVNPLFSLLDSMFSEEDFDSYRYMEEERARAIVESITSSDNDSTERWLTTPRPNIILLVVEGMGRTITEATVDGADVTPNINALAKEGLWFDSLYASSFRTDRGTVATLSGFPAQPQMSVMKYPSKAANLPGIASTLSEAGYATRLFYGGDANFTNTRAYLYATGYDEVIDESVWQLDGHRSKWGYADDAVLSAAAEAIIERMDSGVKSFDTILTLSSHEPFEVPYERLHDKTLNAFAFTDATIGVFVERMRHSRHWEELIIIIIPDHGYPYPSSVSSSSAERHHIPMIWLGGALAKRGVIEDYAAQTDLAATLLAQLGLEHDDFVFSRNIAAEGAKLFGYWTFNNGFGVIDSEGVTIYDCDRDEVEGNTSSDHAQRIEYGKAMLQTTFSEIDRL